MTRVLILLTLPPDVTAQYRARLGKLFPELDIDVVSQREQAEAALTKADVLVTFGQMMKNLKLGLDGASNLKWVQALGTGLDGITDQPAIRPSVTVTSLHGVHGAPVSEAALAGMLALSRDIPRFARNQDTRTWGRWPAKLLHDKTVGILGIGVIAEALAPKCKAFGMKVVGLTSVKRDVRRFRQRARYGRTARRAAASRLPGAADALLGRNSPHDRRQGVRGDEADQLSDQRGARRRGGRGRAWSWRCARSRSRARRSTCSSTSRCRPSIRFGRSRTSSSPPTRAASATPMSTSPCRSWSATCAAS